MVAGAFGVDYNVFYPNGFGRVLNVPTVDEIKIRFWELTYDAKQHLLWLTQPTKLLIPTFKGIRIWDIRQPKPRSRFKAWRYKR